MRSLLRALWLAGSLAAAVACGGDDAADGFECDIPLDRPDAAAEAGADADVPAEADAPPESETIGPDAGETSDDEDAAAGDVPPGDADGADDDGEDACDPDATEPATVVVLSPAELHALLETEDPILLDVFDGDIPEIPGTDAHLPFTDVDAIEAYLGHDLCANVVLYCRRGVRSGETGATLVERGYRRVRVLDGGIEAWQAAGYPVDP